MNFITEIQTSTYDTFIALPKKLIRSSVIPSDFASSTILNSHELAVFSVASMGVVFSTGPVMLLNGVVIKEVELVNPSKW